MRNIVKSLYIVSFLVLFILNSAGSSGAASMLEGLTSFQESLTGWVDKVEDLEQRFSAVENDLEVKDKQLAEINSSLSKIEDLLSKLDSKIIVVQNMRSVAGLKKTLKSYEDTLDVFKKRFAEMAKRLEDQEVKISVLEKVYATAQNPVQTMMSELDQQNKRINVLADKVENQDKSLLVITEGIKKSKTPSEDIEKKIEEFNTRLTGLESDAISMRDTVAQKGHGTGTGEDAGSHATESTDHVVAGHQAESHDAGAHRQESQEMEGYIDIGMGFFVKDLKFSSFGSSCRVDGEMVNKSERYYSSADFVLKVFNNVGRQLGGHSFSIIALNQDHKKVFQEILTGVNEKEITNYTLYYAKMSSLLAKGEEELKMLERKHEGLVAEEAGRGSHKEKNGEREKPQVSKGFEDVGNGLYIGNVTFSVFGSSSSVAGVIQNHSDTDIDSASFLMKVFSKSYGMIASLDFSVRRLDAGSSKPFEEILTGVQPTDIDRYEVTVKGSY